MISSSNKISRREEVNELLDLLDGFWNRGSMPCL